MLYVATLVEHENGGRANEQIIGVFSTKVLASIALDKVFHEMCDRYGVQELGVYDYYTEGESFYLEGSEMEFVVYANIYEQEVDKTNKIVAPDNIII